jgi:hypothetical protein
VNDQGENTRLAQLEKDLLKEESFRDGINKIMAITEPKKQADLQKQIQNCLRNIQNIKNEMEALKSVTIRDLFNVE